MIRNDDYDADGDADYAAEDGEDDDCDEEDGYADDEECDADDDDDGNSLGFISVIP